MEDDATRDVATVLKAVRGLTAQEFDSALLPPSFKMLSKSNIFISESE